MSITAFLQFVGEGLVGCSEFREFGCDQLVLVRLCADPFVGGVEAVGHEAEFVGEGADPFFAVGARCLHRRLQSLGFFFAAFRFEPFAFLAFAALALGGFPGEPFGRLLAS